MHLSNILAISMAIPAFAHTIPLGASGNPVVEDNRQNDTHISERDLDPALWPQRKVSECGFLPGGACDEVAVIEAGQKSGPCIRSPMKDKRAIILPSGIMCEYWRTDDCTVPAEVPDNYIAQMAYHLGPYGGADIQAGTGQYSDLTYQSKTFPMYDPGSYKCSVITFNNVPAEVLYCQYANCWKAGSTD